MDDLDDDEFLMPEEPEIIEPQHSPSKSPQPAPPIASSFSAPPAKLESPIPEYAVTPSSPMSRLSTATQSPGPPETSTSNPPSLQGSGAKKYTFASSSFLPIDVLGAYFEKNPWPTWDQIDELREGRDLSRRQLGDWFSRHRRMNGVPN